MRNETEFLSRLGVWGEFRAVVHDGVSGETVSDQTMKNLITTLGLQGVADQLAGSNTTELQLRHLAVGTDSTAPTVSDTVLGFESARETVSSASRSGVVASVAAFFASGDFVGTAREFGAFGDMSDTTSTAAADSGALFSHVTTTTTVSTGNTLTLTYRVTAVES